MTPQELLAELEHLSHRGRTKRMVELGRDPAQEGVIAALEAGATSYERRLALLSCATARGWCGGWRTPPGGCADWP